MAKYRESKKKAFAKGYFTGRNHYEQLPDSGHGGVRRAARRGYRKGLRDRHFQAKQERLLKN